MTRFATILTATAMILGSMIWTANAQIQTLGRIVRRVTFGTGTGAARASE